MSHESSDLLTGLLKEVSRSFYLTMRVLPSAIRPQISLAYLLARTTDTIADTELVPIARRLETLADLRDRILGARAAPVDFSGIADKQQSTGERAALLRCEEALQILSSLPSQDQQLIREVLQTIVSGQELDLQRFAGANAGRIVALQNALALDDYTYRVAGCVGEFWTKMCLLHLFPANKESESKLLAEGIRFGKGLQLVNILRDIPRDLRQGRCYLPLDQLKAAGLEPHDLLSPANEGRCRSIYNAHLKTAENYLASGWNYTISLPRGQIRVRLACAWPILIGQKTVQKLHRENPLDPERRIKVSRSEIRSILLRSIALLPLNNQWNRQGCQS